MRRAITCAVCGSANYEPLVVAHGNRGQAYISLDHPVAVCTDCGLVYLNPQHEEADYQCYYRTADYKPIRLAPERFLKQNAYRRIQAAYLLDTMRALWPDSDPKELTVLDIGCGPGALLAFLKESGINAVGLEASPVAADYARNALGLSVITGSINDAVLPSSDYDIAVSTASIEHFTDPLAAVRQMLGALRPGGLLYINTPDVRGCVLKKGLGNCFKFVHTYYFTEASLTNLLHKAGASIVRSWTMPPVLKANVLHPGNYCSGELNIIARKEAAAAGHELRRESVAEIRAAYENARRRDRVHAWFRNAYQRRPVGLARRVLARLLPPQPLFKEFFLSEKRVDARRFPDLLGRGWRR